MYRASDWPHAPIVAQPIAESRAMTATQVPQIDRNSLPDGDEVRKALGRSPDKGDAVAMTFVSGIPAPNKTRNHYQEAPAPDWRT